MPIESHGLSPHDALPGLATAFDEEAMKRHVRAALFGDRSRHTVERCTPTRPLYVPGEYCLLRYRFRARNGSDGTVLEPIVMGRVFPDESTCAAYMRDKLAPVAARMRGRPEVAAFDAPAAMIEALSMVVHVWPVDGELPTLVDATDRRRMLDVFREALPEVGVEDCEIQLVSYRRRQRCVLRYTVAGKDLRRLVVYGKVTAFGDEARKSRTIEALRERIGERAAAYRFTLPRSLGPRPELALSLFEAIPGELRIRPALDARLRGRPAPDTLPLEEMVATAGHVAALLHTSGVAVGRPRAFEDELAGLQGQITLARQFAPSFGERAASWLERIAALAEETEPLELRLSHGDFKHEQLLFDGSRSGLVDFDRLCQAEPALDLGKFVAHLRSEVRKLERRASMSSTLADELAERFVGAYVDAAAKQIEDEPRLRRRTALYEAIALSRLALISQLDLDEARVERTAALLEERMTGPAPGS